ncbi:hypothetical protein [uncultured Rubinisphaera sp.]|uniref:hypothetical protein n=1 Tax=uncultured Rubinisphaera sp. TaxID=1678686 RepID=UPI0030D84DF2
MYTRFLTLAALICCIGCSESTSPQTSTNETNAPAIPTTPVKYESGQTLTVNVPDMHCPFACYPKVKQTIADQPGVESVELVEQEDENAINDPRIIVKLNGEFDSTSAIDALSKVGFKESQVVATK